MRTPKFPTLGFNCWGVFGPTCRQISSFQTGFLLHVPLPAPVPRWDLRGSVGPHLGHLVPEGDAEQEKE